MDHLEYLFAGFAVFWAGLLVYLLWLQARLHGLNREIARLEERLAETEGRGVIETRHESGAAAR